jgi:hypothetical protein
MKMSNDNYVGIEWVNHCSSNDWEGICCASIEDATTETLIETMLEINNELLRREREDKK